VPVLSGKTYRHPFCRRYAVPAFLVSQWRYAVHLWRAKYHKDINSLRTTCVLSSTKSTKPVSARTLHAPDSDGIAHDALPDLGSWAEKGSSYFPPCDAIGVLVSGFLAPRSSALGDSGLTIPPLLYLYIWRLFDMQLPCISHGRGNSPSACLSHACILLSKRRKLGSWNLYCRFSERLLPGYVIVIYVFPKNTKAVTRIKGIE